MNDSRGGDAPDDLKASIDDRVAEALEAEYTRERWAPVPSPDSTTQRRLVPAGLAVVTLIAILAGVLWTRGVGSDNVAIDTTLPAVTPTSTPMPTTTTPEGPTPDLQPRDVDSLTTALQAQSARLTPFEEPLELMGLTGNIHHLCVNDVPLFVLEYSTEAGRQRESDGISSDARIPVSQDSDAITEWVAPPRFFAQGRIIVLALGADAATLDTLIGLLGDTLTPDGQGLSPSSSCSPQSP